MFNFSFSNKQSPIALDLGADSIKMLQVRKSGTSAAVTAAARWRFSESAAADNDQRRQAAVVAIREMLKKGNFKGRKVVSAIPSGDLNIKNVRLPHMEEADLLAAIAWEAKERFPFETSPDQMGYINAGSVRVGNETRDEIIMFAAPREAVDRHLGIILEAGLQPQHIDVEPLAIFRSFDRYLRRKVDEQTVTVIADIGLTSTRVIISRGRQIVFLKNIDIGGRKLNEAVAKRCNLSYAEAVELRMRLAREAQDRLNAAADLPADAEAAPEREDDSSDLAVRDAIRADVEALSKEMALCLRYCSVTFRGMRPDKVLLTGGEAYDCRMTQLLREYLNIQCTLGAPLRGLDLSAVDMGPDRRSTLAEWTACAGLAIRCIELEAVEEEGENERNRLTA